MHEEPRSALPAYRSCVAKHSEFHVAAGCVAQAINAGQFDAAGAMRGVGTPYAAASGEVVTAIMRLKKDAQL